MKKFLTILAIVFSSFNLSAQQFAGVNISGTLTDCINSFKEKGFVLKSITNGTGIMTGRVANYPVEIFISVTPKTKQVWKVTAYLDKEESWYELKSEYNKFKEILTEKYGEPSGNYEYFKNPYYEGDGYEVQALRVKKCTYLSIWLNRADMNVSVEITSFEAVSLSYENVKLAAVKRAESQELENKEF